MAPTLSGINSYENNKMPSALTTTTNYQARSKLHPGILTWKHESDCITRKRPSTPPNLESTLTDWLLASKHGRPNSQCAMHSRITTTQIWLTATRRAEPRTSATTSDLDWTVLSLACINQKVLVAQSLVLPKSTKLIIVTVNTEIHVRVRLSQSTQSDTAFTSVCAWFGGKKPTKKS
jgi:hypothetical protein